MLNVQQDDADFRRAAELQARGQNAQAENACKAILARSPRHAGAMHLLGILTFHRGDLNSAAKLIEQSLAVSPATDAYANLAEVRRQLRDPQSAIELCRRALAQDPNFSHAHLHLALAHHDLKQLDQAMAHARRVLELVPNSSRPIALLGVIYAELNRFAESAAMFEQAVRLEPRELVPLLNLGCVYRELTEFDKAIEVHRRALALAPENANVWLHLGISLAQARQHEESRHWLEKAVAAAPTDATPLQNLATLLVETRDFEQALALAQRGVQLEPNRKLMWIVIHKAYAGMGRFVEGEAALQKALSLGEDASVWKALTFNRAMATQFDKALEAAERVIQLDPNTPINHFDRAVLLLTFGRFAEGWDEYEWRRQLPELKKEAPTTAGPEWKGEPLDGKSILLITEQGFGDAIQFVRYAEMVNARAAKVVVRCDPRLTRLFQRAKGVSEVTSLLDPPKTDTWCSLVSLPHRFKTDENTIPQSIPYISAYPQDIAAWQKRLRTDSPALKVGLSWSGRPTHGSDHVRSMSYRDLLPLMNTPGVEFYSLQKGLPREQVQPLVDAGLIDVSEEQTDFAHTAALIDQLDLVLSVDTAVAHLAAALNKPTWVFLATYADWRWRLGRETTPWYPSMRLFRQTAFKDWVSVVQRVKTELQTFKR